MAPEPARSWRTPFRLESTAQRDDGQRVPIVTITDNTFMIELTDRPPEPKLLFLEADCGSEPLERTDGLQGDLSDFARKIIGYSAYGEAGGHLEQFGVNNFRVLTVTTSQRRAENLVSLTQRLTSRGLGRFLFTDRETLERYRSDVLSLPWRNGRGEAVRLGH